MPPVSRGTRGLLGAAGNALNIGMFGVFAYQDANERIKQGENPSSAWAKAGARQIPWLIMSAPAAMAFDMIPMLPAITRATTMAWQARSGYIRSASTPFSHRFEHTDATAKAMQRGLSAISNSRGELGSEAYNMSRRYTR